PYIWAISKSRGRLVISESGRLNYLFFVNHTTPGWYFQNLGTARGNYLHTARRIHASPPIYEFASPIKGTQPIWYDPSYWSDGAVPKLHLHAWIALIMSHFRVYAQLLWHYQLILLICGGLLVWMGNKRTWICVREQMAGTRSGIRRTFDVFTCIRRCSLYRRVFCTDMGRPVWRCSGMRSTSDI